MAAGESVIIITMVAAFIGAVITFVTSFKKQPGSRGKKGLFATAMLSVYALFISQVFPHTNFYWKQFIIPLLGFAALAIIEMFKQKGD